MTLHWNAEPLPLRIWNNLAIFTFRLGLSTIIYLCLIQEQDLYIDLTKHIWPDVYDV